MNYCFWTCVFIFMVAACDFVAVTASECPSNGDLSECTDTMNNGDFCEADRALPDGTTYFDINNCGGYDIFKCVKGTNRISKY